MKSGKEKTKINNNNNNKVKNMKYKYDIKIYRKMKINHKVEVHNDRILLSIK